MADKNGILIDVGFKSDDIDGFINRIQTKLQDADLGKSLKLDNSLKNELQSISTLLDNINNSKTNINTKNAQQSIKKISQETLEAQIKFEELAKKISTQQFNISEIKLDEGSIAETLSDIVDDINQALGNAKIGKGLKNTNLLDSVLNTSSVESFQDRTNKITEFTQNLINAIEILRKESTYRGLDEGILSEQISLADFADFGISELDPNKIADAYQNKLKQVTDAINAKTNSVVKANTRSESDYGALPLHLELQDNTELLQAKINIIYESLKAYAEKKPVEFKVDLVSNYQSTAISKNLKKLNGLLPNLDDEKTKAQAEELLTTIGENFTKGFELKINTGELKTDLDYVKNIVKELQSSIENANKNLVLSPTVDDKQLKASLDKYNKITEEYANEQAKKTNKRSLFGGRSTDEVFINNLDLIIRKFKELTATESGLENLLGVFQNLKDFTEKLSEKDLSKGLLLANLKAINAQLKVTPNNGISSQMDAIISKSKPMAEVVKSINFKEVTDGFTGLQDTVSNINAFANAFSRFKNSLNGTINTTKLEENISKVNGELGKLNTSKIDKVEGVNSLAESFNTDKLKEGLETQKATIESFINDVQSYKDEYAAKITEMSEQTDNVKLKLDFGQVEQDLSKISASINNINIPTTPNGVLTVLNELLNKEGAIDKLIALSNSPLGTTIANTKSLAIDDKAIKNNGIERFYSSIDAGKQKLNAAIKNGDLTSINEYYRSVQKISEAYNNIKKTDRTIISQEEFEAARSQLESFVKDTNVMINSIFDNLHPSIKEKFADEIDQVQVYLKATQIKPKKLSGAKDIEDNKAALIEVLNLIERINKEGFLEKSIAEADNRLDILSNKLVRVTSAFEKVSKTPTVANSDNLYTELTQLLELKERIAKDNELQLISDSQMNEANRRIESVISSFKESYKANLTRQFADVPLSGFTDQINAIDASVDNAMKALNKFDVNTFNAEINQASAGITNLNNAMKATSEYNKESEAFNTALNRLPELQQKAFKGNIGDVNEFVNQLRMVQEQYTRLEEQAKKAGLTKAFDETKTAVNDIISALSQGYNTVIEKEKKLYADVGQIAKNKNVSAQVQNAFSGGISSNLDLVKQAMLEGHNNYASVISDQNVVASGLTYEKVLGKIYNSLIKNSGASKELKGELRSLAKEMESAGANGTSKTMLDAYSKRFQSIDTEIKRTGQTGISFFDRLGKSMTSQTSQLIAMTFSFYRLISVFKQGIQTAVEFDTALAKISYTMDVSQSGIEGMGESMMNLASELKTSLSSIEQIYTIYANMNTSDKEVENLSRYTAVLSNLSGIDASTAADDIQAVVNQFENLNSTDTSHIVDVFDYISRNISVDYQKGIEGMAEGVQAVGNVADQAGLSYEQLSAIIAKTMEQTRNSGSSIANGLKTIMVRLSKASTMDDEVDNSTLSKASSVLHEIGVEVYTASGEYREFDTIMTELAAKWDSLTEAQQANISFQIAATRQTATLKAILQNWTESMDLANEAVYTQGNALENQEKHAETYAAKIQEMKNSFETLAINLMNTDGFDALLSTIEKATQGISDFVSAFGLIPTVTAGAMLIPFIKNLGSLKQNLSSATDSGKLVIKTMKDINSSNIVYSKNYEKLALALNGLNANQAKLVISNSQVAKSERKVAMAEYERLNATLKLTRSQVLEKFNNRGLEDSQVTSINTQLSEAYNSNKWSKATIMNMLSDEKLHIDPKLQEEIIKDIEAENVQYSKQIGLLGNLKEKYTAFAASLGLTAKQLTAVLGVIGSLYIAYRVFDKLIVSEKEYEEKSIESLERITKVLGEIDQINSELENTTQKLKELESQDTISLADQGEINKLKETNTELERSLRAKKELAKVEADLATETAEEDPTLKKYKGYQPIVTEAPEKARNYYRHKRKDEYFTDTKSGLITVNGFDTPYEALIATAEAYREALESDSEKADEIKKTLDELYAKNEKKYEIFQKAIEAGNDYSDNEYYQGTVSGRNAYFKSLFESNPNDLDAFKLMSKEDKISAFSEQFEKALKQQSEALNISANEIDNYMNSAKGALKDLSSEKLDELFNKKIDFSKYIIPEEELNNKLKTYDILGKAFEYSISDNNASKYHEAQIGSYITHLYVKAKEALDATGKEYSDKKLFAEMFKLDESGEEVHEVNEAGKVIGRIFIQGILDTPSAATNPFGRLIEAWLKDVTETKENKISFEEAWAGLDNEETGTKLKESLTKLADEGKLTKENFLKEDGAKTWADKLNIDLDEAIKKINSLSKDTSRLSNLKGSVSKLQNAYSEKRDAVLTNQDQTKQKGKLNKVEAASASTINDLEADFGGLKYWKKYKEIIGSTTSTVDECREATNKLLTEFYNEGKYINEVVDATGKVDKSTKDYYISQMEELGVANAAEVVNKEILQRKVEIYLANKDLTDASNEQLTAIAKEAEALNDESVAADEARKMINLLVLQKLTAKHTSLAIEGDLSYLKQLATFAESAGLKIAELAQAEAMYAQAEALRKSGSGSASVADELFKKADALRKKGETKLEKKLKIGVIASESPRDSSLDKTTNTNTKNTQKKTKEYIDWIERYIEEQQHKINAAEAKLANVFGEKSQNKIYNKIIKYYGNIAKAYKVASKKYKSSFNAFLGSKDGKKYINKDIENRIKNGTISGDPKKLIQTFGEERGKVIKEAIDRWKKYEDAEVNAEKSLTDKRNARIEKIQKQADRRQASMELNKQYAEAEERGYKAQNDYLDKSQKKNEQRIKKLIKIAKIEHDITEQKKLQEELEQSRIENEKAKFDNLIADYERQRAANERNIQRTQNSMDLQAARGMNISEKYYRSQNSQYNAELKNINNELAKAREKIKSIKQGTDERNEAEQNILDLETEYNTKLQSIYNNNKAIVELYNNYLDTRANVNDRMLNELSFLDSLADYAKHTSKEVQGFFTDAGYAALDVARKGMEISKSNMEMYADNLARLQKARKNADGTFTYLTKEGDSVTFNSELDYVKELQNAYDKVQNYAKSYYDNTVKAVDLMKERYQTELELVKDLVDAKKQELDAEKDLHDYQRTISEKTTNITNLERQLAAYSGNTSEEGRAKLQSLQKQLSDAQKDLEETEYDRYISDQKNMLDDLYQKYNDEVTKRLDQFNKLLEEALGENGAITEGNAFLNQIAKGIGYDSEYNVLKGLDGLKKEIATLGQRAYKDSGMDDGKGNNNGGNNNGRIDVPVAPKVENPPMLYTVAAADLDKKAKQELLNKVKDIVSNSKYQKKDTNNISDVNKLLYKKYRKALTTNGLKTLANVLGVPYGKDKNSLLYKALKEIGFAKGGIASIIKKNGDDGIATLKRGEAVLTPKQTREFTTLAKNLEFLNHATMLNANVPKQEFNNSISYGDMTFNFELPNVTDSQTFLNEVKNNQKLQKALQEVTIKQLIDPNKLGVKKIK